VRHDAQDAQPGPSSSRSRRDRRSSTTDLRLDVNNQLWSLDTILATPVLTAPLPTMGSLKLPKRDSVQQENADPRAKAKGKRPSLQKLGNFCAKPLLPDPDEAEDEALTVDTKQQCMEVQEEELRDWRARAGGASKASRVPSEVEPPVRRSHTLEAQDAETREMLTESARANSPTGVEAYDFAAGPKGEEEPNLPDVPDGPKREDAINEPETPDVHDEVSCVPATFHSQR
jgi:hypothetical protein